MSHRLIQLGLESQGALMNIRYRIDLTDDEWDELHRLLSAGKCSARKLKRAQILLAADGDTSDEEIERAIGASGSTIYRTKRRFVELGLEAALREEPRPGASRKLNGKEEALLVATACSKPPAGRARWTLELLAGEMVKLTEHAELSRETVRPPPGGERSEAVAPRHVVHPRGRRHLCRPHGGRARSLCRAARSEVAGSVLRREPDPTDRRGPPADSGQGGPARALRLRVSPQRHGQPVRLPRCPPALAHGQGHRPAHRPRLRPLHRSR